MPTPVPGTLTMGTATPADLTRRLALALEPCGVGLAARELVIAHAGYESDWGASRPSKVAFNHWNLTRIPADARPVIEGGDHDAQGRHIVQRFRAYASDAEAVADYLDFLSQPGRHSGGLHTRSAYEALLQGDAPQFVILLKEGGFFEAPLAGYQSGIASCLAVARRLLAPPEPVA